VRVLIAEDDPGVQHFVVKGLKEHAYAVDAVANGIEALEQAEINSYDLIILDVMLPGLSGFEVCRRLREAGLKIPVLMLTARDAVEDRIAGLDHGADDYLTKPFEFLELLARMRALLRRPAELKPSQLSVDNLTLDTAAQVAVRGDRRISLTHKEYALLEYLVRNSGRVALVFTAARVAELVAQLKAHRLEPKRIRFVHPRANAPAAIVLIEARKGGGVEAEVEPPLILYSRRGVYSDEARALLALDRPTRHD